jgi:hypothetical protein
VNIARLERLAQDWEARLLAAAAGRPHRPSLNGYMAQGANLVLADVKALLREGDDPPAPGHRRLTEIIADLHHAEPGAEVGDLHREFAAAAEALFDSHAAAMHARRGNRDAYDRWASGGEHRNRFAGHLGAPGTGCPLCVGAEGAPGFLVCTERCEEGRDG